MIFSSSAKRYFDNVHKTISCHVSVSIEYCRITTTGFALRPEKWLQVESLGLSLALGLEHALSCLPKVGHVDSHSPLSQSHETSLTAHGANVGTRKIILLVDKLFEINIVCQRHFGSVKSEDFALGVF